MSEVSSTKNTQISDYLWLSFLASLFAVFVCWLCYFAYHTFEIKYDDYKIFSTYLDHDVCGELARDYASDGRVTDYEYLMVRMCARKDEKRKFYSKFEAQ